MPANRFLNPKSLSAPPGYTHVVETTTPGRIVYIAGQLGLDRDGKVVGAPGDFRAQAEQAFANLRDALAEVGASFADVVKINNYLVNMEHLDHFREVRDTWLNTSAPPASTTVAISRLAREGALFEIEAVAVLPAPAARSAAAKSGRSKATVRRPGKHAKAKVTARKRK